MTAAQVPDLLILGFNPLMGTDHYLRERARNPQRKQTRESAVRVAQMAVSAGAEGLNLNAGPSAVCLLNDLVDAGLDRHVGLYPMVPDERFFGSLLNQGTMGAISAVLSGLSITDKAKALLSGGWAWITNDPLKAIQVYLETEIERLNRAGGSLASVRTVLMHELITDSVVGLGATEAFSQYIEEFRSRNGIPPGFVTRNFVRFSTFCRASGHDPRSIIVMTPVNTAGFQMAPSRDEVERELARLNGQNIIGISVFASGLVPFSESVAYLRGLRGVRSVAIGVSTLEHAKSTFSVLKGVMRDRDSPVPNTSRQV